MAENPTLALPHCPDLQDKSLRAASTEAKNKAPVRLETCGDIFHKGCIIAWLKSDVGYACPICNTKLYAPEWALVKIGLFRLPDETRPDFKTALSRLEVVLEGGSVSRNRSASASEDIGTQLTARTIDPRGDYLLAPKSGLSHFHPLGGAKATNNPALRGTSSTAIPTNQISQPLVCNETFMSSARKPNNSQLRSKFQPPKESTLRVSGRCNVEELESHLDGLTMNQNLHPAIPQEQREAPKDPVQNTQKPDTAQPQPPNLSQPNANDSSTPAYRPTDPVPPQLAEAFQNLNTRIQRGIGTCATFEIAEKLVPNTIEAMLRDTPRPIHPDITAYYETFGARARAREELRRQAEIRRELSEEGPSDAPTVHAFVMAYTLAFLAEEILGTEGMVDEIETLSQDSDAFVGVENSASGVTEAGHISPPSQIAHPKPIWSIQDLRALLSIAPPETDSNLRRGGASPNLVPDTIAGKLKSSPGQFFIHGLTLQTLTNSSPALATPSFIPGLQHTGPQSRPSQLHTPEQTLGAQTSTI
ncbi:hypothetical protein B0J11DRAFT_512679 [Dendryphion nanum]|uniref:RING-type domain-containing protein n=1 Tax=Dendryphion nanum TaxID=256645 RepID=A0A9P9I6N5_9PLEO|nr:hypothetical protein B0J11DRAFT_512679 [Dendryphion nanum]